MDPDHIDPVSDMLSRIDGIQAAARLAREADDSGTALVAVWLDLDRFRQINSSFGHAGGDSVILRTVQRIRTRVPANGLLARMGSDEFVCLVPHLDRCSAEQFALALVRIISEPIQLEDIIFRMSVSVGVALRSPQEDALALLERADRAMVEAKRQGGCRLVVSGDDPTPGRLGVLLARDDLVIENDLHTALETGGLSLHYQPIVAFDGRLEAVEALMRCSINGRQISPEVFIPVAETTGVIVRLGEWCLLEGAQCAARLQREGRPTKVAINVSRAQITSPKFMHALHGALICANVSPSLVELEITESLFMDLSDTVLSNLRSVRDTGLGLSIDDFGTGYSCLSNLKDLPATKLKLDRAFVCVLPDDRRAFAVVKAMTRLAHDLGMVVVAEGVETPAQMDCLQDAEVDAIQGYIHARPMPEEALMDWARQQDTPKP